MTLLLATHVQDDHLHATISGPYVEADFNRLYESLLTMVGQQRLGKVLLDLRDLGGAPSLIEKLAFLAVDAKLRLDMMVAGKRTDFMLAFVATPPVAEADRPVVTRMVNRGLVVAGYERLDDAIGWLNGG